MKDLCDFKDWILPYLKELIIKKLIIVKMDLKIGVI
jgi:hypothetical protein